MVEVFKSYTLSKNIAKNMQKIYIYIYSDSNIVFLQVLKIINKGRNVII